MGAAPLTTPLSETLLHACTATVLLAAVTGSVATSAALAVGTLASGAALLRALHRRRELARRRAAADAILADVPGARIPDRLRWRVDELGNPAHRRQVARQLRRLARMADQPILITSVPVSLSTLRPNHDELESVAAIVGELTRPVRPRGLVLLERLLCSSASPLYRPASADELARALTRVQRALG